MSGCNRRPHKLLKTHSNDTKSIKKRFLDLIYMGLRLGPFSSIAVFAVVSGHAGKACIIVVLKIAEHQQSHAGNVRHLVTSPTLSMSIVLPLEDMQELHVSVGMIIVVGTKIVVEEGSITGTAVQVGVLSVVPPPLPRRRGSRGGFILLLPPCIIILMVLLCPTPIGGLSCCGHHGSCSSSSCATAAATCIPWAISIAEYVIVQ
jgi:hypothetical protein